MNLCELLIMLLIHETMQVTYASCYFVNPEPMLVLIMLLIHEPMQVVMLQNHESMQVINYVVNHNYMRSYHVIFPSCHA